MLGHRAPQAEVAHHRRDQRAVDEHAALGHREREDRHDLVAVDDAAEVVDGEAAVGVAVVGDAEVGAVVHDRGREGLEVGRADAVVDVEAVGVGADHGDAGAGVA